MGAVVAVLVMLFLPNAGSLHFSTRLFLGLNMAMWFGLFSLIFLDTSINVAMQPFKMMVSLLGYLFPIFFTWIGIANEAPEGVVPDSVVYSFYVGAAILILCVLYTFLRVREMPPAEYAEFHGIEIAGQAGNDGKASVMPGSDRASKGLGKLLVEAPKTFWTVGLVQFFCWAAFLYMWTYTNGAVAVNCWGVDMTAENAAATAGYQAAGNWVGVLFAVQAVGSILWASVLPRFKNIKLGYVVSLLIGAIGFASAMFIHNQYALFVSFFLIGFAWAAMLALPFTLLTNALEGSPYMGSYLGLFNCTICLPLLMAGIFLVLGAVCVRFISTKKAL